MGVASELPTDWTDLGRHASNRNDQSGCRTVLQQSPMPVYSMSYQKQQQTTNNKGEEPNPTASLGQQLSQRACEAIYFCGQASCCRQEEDDQSQ
jgi:hypothetical protein